MIHLTSHTSQSAAYTSIPAKLQRGLFITWIIPGVNPLTSHSDCSPARRQRESGICQCVFVFLGAGASHIVWACGSCRTFNALCGSVIFYWSVMKFPCIINPELYPYMSPAVRRRCPGAACLFQFTARTDIVRTWCFITELFKGEDIWRAALNSHTASVYCSADLPQTSSSDIISADSWARITISIAYNYTSLIINNIIRA